MFSTARCPPLAALAALLAGMAVALVAAGAVPPPSSSGGTSCGSGSVEGTAQQVSGDCDAGDLVGSNDGLANGSYATGSLSGSGNGN